MTLLLWRIISPHKRKRSTSVDIPLYMLFVVLCCATVAVAQTENLQYFVKENEDSGTVIVILSTDESYIYNSGSKNVDTDFDLIEIAKGKIVTTKKLDRETIDTYRISLYNLNNGKLIQITITVNDTNDFAPTFSSDDLTLEISELSEIGSPFSLGSALDPDLPPYNVQGYRILTNEDSFKFNISSTLLTTGNRLIAELVLNEKLDRETKTSHNLTVEAYDGGFPNAKTGTLNVHVIVTDSNDNPPIFDKTNYNVTVPENTPVKKAIVVVNAEDSDAGDNGVVTYRFAQNSDPGSLFGIDADTGVVCLNKALDAETSLIYHILIEAMDGGRDPLVGSAYLTVNVQDINDNTPMINVVFFTQNQGQISEGAEVGDLIARVSVSDPDIEQMLNVDMFLFGGNDKFELATDDGIVYLLKIINELDRETKSSYTLTLNATERDSVDKSASYVFTLEVLDINDNAPEFNSDLYEVDVDENSVPGTFVIRLYANDKDMGDNARFQYEMTSSAQSTKFKIDPNSGVITTTDFLDHETTSEHALEIFARDFGSIRMFSKCLVKVYVGDENDSVPKFNQSSYTFSVDEDAQIGTCFGQVHATDHDLPSHQNSIVYAWSEVSPATFSLSPNTGEICTRTTIDRELKSSYQLKIKATDQSQMHNTVDVYVIVNDNNDNRPKFHPLVYAINVPALSTSAGDVIIKVKASDEDDEAGTEFGRVFYSIIDGNDDGLFAIDKVSGEILAAMSFPPANIVRNLRVRATDGGGLTSETDAGVTISILNGTWGQHVEGGPTFTQESFKFHVKENVDLKTRISGIRATSKDDSSVRYILMDDLPHTVWFSLDPLNGDIVVEGDVDREIFAQLDLQILAVSGNPPVYAFSTATVVVDDENDNAPVFTKTRDEVVVPYSTDVNQLIYTILAVDADVGVNSQITYELLNNPSDLFVIDESNGKITLAKPLPQESASYSLSVGAKDNGISPQSADEFQLGVKTLPPDDSCVQFAYEEFKFAFHENLPIFVSFGNISTSAARNSRVLSLSQDVDAFPFNIYANGSLYLRFLLDREVKSQYEFEVLAHSTAPSVFTTTCVTRVVVEITVIDVNDNHPVFTQSSFVFNIKENLPSGKHVGTASAYDVDDDKNAKLTYTLLNELNNFNINSKTGKITTAVSLDQELRSQYFLTVVCSDHGEPSLSTSTVVRVNVVDENDNTPSFRLQTMFVVANLSAAKEVGLSSAQVYATDHDFDENGIVSFSLSSNQQFEVDSTSGVIRNKQLLMKSTTHTIIAAASDNGNPALQSDVELHIYMPNDEDNPNKFNSDQYAFAVGEDIVPGFILGRLDDPFDEVGRVTRSVEDETTFLIADGNFYGLFEINATSGEIFTVQELDFENAIQYDLTIEVSKGSENKLISAQINLQDRNNYYPIFHNHNYAISVGEDMPVGSVVYKLKASDKDSGLNGMILFAIKSQMPEDMFRIDAQSGEILIQRVLDRENFTQSIMVVMATDSGDVPRSNSVAVVITIRDVNDNAPVFQSPTQLFVQEDEPVGFPVTYITARDADVASNARVYYNIESQWSDAQDTKQQHEEYFALDSKSGFLSLLRSLDHETATTHFLNISGTNAASNIPLVTFQLFFVNVIDVNDESPQFKQSKFDVQISEDVDIGYLVIRLTATDHDSGDNGQLKYQLHGDMGIFSINEDSGVIVTSQKLNREEKDKYTITIIVHDMAFPMLYDICTVMIEVLDVNDNPPQFHTNDDVIMDSITHMPIIATLSIPESDAGNSTILHVIATDEDVGLNGQIIFSIRDGNIENAFSIDQTSGTLHTTRRFDREEMASYKLIVTAQDSGDVVQLSTDAVVLVDVLDWNDNDPEFTQTTYEATVVEGMPKGEYVTTVHAVDADEGLNGQVIYTLKHSEDGSEDCKGLFSVDESTGAITTAGHLDREKLASYQFQVEARDCAIYGGRRSFAMIIINVLDVNDNAPVFITNLYQLNISSFLLPQTALVKVESHDKDDGENGRIYYRISSVETQGGGTVASSSRFGIDFTTGQIMLQQTLSIGRYILNVIASDNGVPSLSSSAVVVVNVEFDENINNIAFDKPIYSEEIDEEVESGLFVIQVTARLYGDIAVTTNPADVTIVYSFPSGNDDGTFDITSHGDISVKDPSNLDYETFPVIRLIVSAIATGGVNGQMHAYCTVVVNLRDVNDNEPRFTQDRYFSKVWEEQPSNTYVLHVTSSDDDSGENKLITYYISSGNVDDAFQIDPVTGIVTTAIQLDREIHEEYKLTLNAQDNGTPRRTGTCILRISVVDVNDHRPVLTTPSALSIPEDEEVGKILTTVTASDHDADPDITFEIVPGNDSHDEYFAIDKHNGKLAMIKALDYEEWSAVEITIRAFDGAYSVQDKIDITVTDVNDNPPIFEKTSYQGKVKELQSVGATVLKVLATDADSDENGRVVYEILDIMPDKPMFAINSTTGLITMNQSAVFHPQSSVYNIIIQAQDSGQQPKSTSVSVQIQINDINNNKPVFNQVRYVATVTESAKQNQHVINVTATDADFTRENSYVYYKITGGNHNNAFKTTTVSSAVSDQTIGYITVAGMLDREDIWSYMLEITAFDNGNPQLSSSCVVDVTINDVNDNMPVFNQSVYYGSVSENMPDQPVLKVFAEDIDSSSQLIYKIVAGNQKSAFEITDCETPSDNCHMIVAKELDFEAISEYRLSVQVWDDHDVTKARSSVVPVVITVEDVNEFSPLFLEYYKHVNLEENRIEGEELFRVSAVDKDGGKFGNLLYSIIQETNDNLPSGCEDAYKVFRINSTTGGMYAITSLDYELCRQYSFKVRVDNYGSQTVYRSLTGSNVLPVTVYLDSVDEFAPVFIAQRLTNNSNSFKFFVPYGANAGFIIGSVKAIDQDSGEDGKIRYSFLVHNSDPQFIINETSGEIKLAKKLDTTSVILSVVVAASNKFETKAQVRIEVTGAPALPWEMQVLVIVFGVIAGIALVIVIILCVKHRRANKHLKEQVNHESVETQKNGFAEREFYDLNSNSMNGINGGPLPVKTTPEPHSDLQIRNSNSTTVHFRNSGRSSLKTRSGATTEVISRQVSGKVLYRRRKVSLSSGRGSEQEDNEVQVITAASESRKSSVKSSKSTWNKMPDSGIQQDVDFTSDPDTRKSPSAVSAESIHVFGEEGGGEEPLPIIQMKRNNIEDPTIFPHSSNTRKQSPKTSQHRSSVESRGSHSRSIDGTVSWSPEFQSIATVFSEIQNQKDNIISHHPPPYRQQTYDDNNAAFRPINSRYSYPNRNHVKLHDSTSYSVQDNPVPHQRPPPHYSMQSRTKPPHVGFLSNYGIGGHSTNSSQQGLSMSSLPRTPISHDSSFTSPAMSPNLSQSPTPLATRSPSISPMTLGGETGFSSSDGMASKRGDDNTRQKQRMVHV